MGGPESAALTPAKAAGSAQDCAQQIPDPLRSDGQGARGQGGSWPAGFDVVEVPSSGPQAVAAAMAPPPVADDFFAPRGGSGSPSRTCTAGGPCHAGAARSSPLPDRHWRPPPSHPGDRSSPPRRLPYSASRACPAGRPLAAGRLLRLESLIGLLAAGSAITLGPDGSIAQAPSPAPALPRRRPHRSRSAPFALGRWRGRRRDDLHPAGRTLPDVWIVPLRVLTVVPIGRRLGWGGWLLRDNG